MVAIEDEAIPYLNEYERMSSAEYQIGVGIEAFTRGYFGDPFGKAHEEYYKASEIENKLAQLSAEYDSASIFTGLLFWLMLLFGGLWAWQHFKFIKTKKAVA